MKLGPPTVSAHGLGCMGMSSIYGAADWDESTATIHRALDLGVTLLDTAQSYGMGHNEVLVGRAIAGRRDEVTLATKAGIDLSSGKMTLRGDPSYLKASVDFSLLRLGVDVIDLYYLHRVAPDTPLEESVGALAETVQAGKVRAIGVCEVTSEQLRAAHAIHPIAAVQSEYSLWWREPEEGVLEVARELGVRFVAYSPLGRGFLTGTVDPRDLDAGDTRHQLPRFAIETADANQVIVDRVREIAAAHEAAPAQVALAWVMARGAIPIPGTKRVKWLEQNAVPIELAEDELATLDALEFTGARY